jgi:hypothetical protein
MSIVPSRVSPDRRLRREALLVLAASVALVAFAYLLPPTLFEGTDWLQLHLPNKVQGAEALRSGRLPLWNPYVGLGRPFLADTETAVLYPPNLLYVVLDPSTALLILTTGHYVLCLLGMLALGRALGLARWTAWLAAACLLWSAPLVARLSAGQVPYVHASCYVPLLFFLALRLQDHFSFARLAALAVALALQLVCGHPQIAWVSWLGIGFFLLGRALPPTERPGRAALAGLGGFALALGAALAQAAPMLHPFLELASQGNRAAPSLVFAAGGTLESWQWASLAMPDGGRRVFTWEANLYGGLLPLVVGVAGLTLVRDRNVRGLLAAGGAGALVALGTRTPAFAVLYALVPGLSSFHIHSRAAFLVVFALILGAALYLSRPGSVRRSVVVLAVGVGLALVGPLAFRALAPAPEAAHEPFPLARLALGAGAAVLAGLAVHLRPARAATLARVGLAVFVLVELGLALGPARRVWAFPVLQQGERPLFEGLLRAGLYGDTGVPPRIALPPWSIRQNAALLYKWSNIAGYNALTLDRVWVFLHEDLGLTPSLDENTYPSKRIYSQGPYPYDSMNLVGGWQVIDRDARFDEAQDVDPSGGWRPPPGRPVLRRAEDPRAYLARSVTQVGDWRQAVTAMAGGHDFHRSPLVENPTGLPFDEPKDDNAAPSRIEITSFEPERVTLETDAREPSLLVLAEAWYPGWSATVDGVSTPCIPANAWMRAVALPAGRHQVELRFHSRWLLPGTLLFLLTAGGLGVLVLRERRTEPWETGRRMM